MGMTKRLSVTTVAILCDIIREDALDGEWCREFTNINEYYGKQSVASALVMLERRGFISQVDEDCYQPTNAGITAFGAYSSERWKWIQSGLIQLDDDAMLVLFDVSSNGEWTPFDWAVRW